ncbi:hypothetical protein JXR93_11575 [bacterium]|nr:hypothetical protein [bacterium]
MFSFSCLPEDLDEPPFLSENIAPIITYSNPVPWNNIANDLTEITIKVKDLNPQDILTTLWFIKQISNDGKVAASQKSIKSAQQENTFSYTIDYDNIECGNYYIIWVLISDRGATDFGDVPGEAEQIEDPNSRDEVRTATSGWYLFKNCGK